MKTSLSGVVAIVALALAGLGGSSISAQNQQDKYTLQVPGGLAFSEVRGYETWQVVGPSVTEAANTIRAILANPVMIKAYQEGVPGNGKAFPDGSKIVKIEWKPKKITDPPFFREHAGHSAWRPDAGRVHRQGQQEILRHARMGICDVRLRPRLRDVRSGHEGQQASGA
jgi:hypothetical protein